MHVRFYVGSLGRPRKASFPCNPCVLHLDLQRIQTLPFSLEQMSDVCRRSQGFGKSTFSALLACPSAFGPEVGDFTSWDDDVGI